MSYITQAQLEERYGERMLVQLTDRSVPAAGVIDAAAVNRAIADTAAAIDGFLAGRYSLPLASVPPLLTDLAGAIAIYKLHRKVSDDKIRTDYEDAMKRLRDIASGTIRLSVAGLEPASGSASTVRTNAPERPFTPASMKGFI